LIENFILTKWKIIFVHLRSFLSIAAAKAVGVGLAQSVRASQNFHCITLGVSLAGDKATPSYTEQNFERMVRKKIGSIFVAPLEKYVALPFILWNPISKHCCLIALNPYKTRVSLFSMHYLIIMLSGFTIKLPEEPKLEFWV
jgi:hypothetical protein